MSVAPGHQCFFARSQTWRSTGHGPLAMRSVDSRTALLVSEQFLNVMRGVASLR
jgi:hypothetical protein